MNRIETGESFSERSEIVGIIIKMNHCEIEAYLKEGGKLNYSTHHLIAAE